MTSVFEVLRTISLCFGGVLIGALVLDTMMLIPYFGTLSPEDGLRAVRFLSPIAWRYLPVCGVLMTSTQVLLVVLAAVYSKPLGGSAMILTYVGLGLSALAVFVNLGFYRRADSAVRAIPPESAAEQFGPALARVELTNSIRVPLYLAGFVCFVIAAVLA